jgi:hypothetical protein
MSETANDTDLVPTWAVTEVTSQEVFAPERVQKILAQIEARAFFQHHGNLAHVSARGCSDNAQRSAFPGSDAQGLRRDGP